MIKKLLSFALAFILIFSMGSTAFAADVYWDLDKDGVLYIGGKGEVPDFDRLEDAPWNKDRSKIKEVIIGSGITYIGNNAFKNCSNLTYVELPDTIKSLGNYTFARCKNLYEIILPKNLKYIGRNCFEYCSKLETVFIPDEVKIIKQCAFTSCAKLALVGIPASVTSIENSAFNDCTHIEAVFYGGNERDWDRIDLDGYNKNLREADRAYNVIYEAFNTGYWAIGENGTMVITGFGAMKDFNNSSDTPWSKYSSRVYRIVFDDNIEGIGANAFANFKNLQEARIPTSIKSIGSNAFANCPSMKDIVYEGRIEKWEQIDFGKNAIPYNNKDFIIYSK